MFKTLLKVSGAYILFSGAAFAEPSPNNIIGEYLPSLFSERVLSITNDANGLMAHSKGQGAFKLIKKSHAEYQLDGPPVTLNFNGLENQKFNEVTLATPKGGVDYYRKSYLFKKYKEVAHNVRPNGLSDAILMDDFDAVKALIDKGIDIHELDTRRQLGGVNGRKPLNWAAQKNDLDVIALLVISGADINSTNLSGYSPLHHAAEYDAVEAIELLIKLGADVKLKTKAGHTVLEVAAMNKSAKSLGVLRANTSAE
ncbi:ankyrin repeat domain-containing protein [Alteromonas sediminis]|uniref:Ankyrin repeat domain-containing protein n=1 Tax=Alteromonas sediminis TaxID=2259342 RepID=A0A3N5XZ81_9ALTE|nr:ankyrin repeat domain-containing protein [Alteromonas sediminis]RPJ65803.1 ankyrin repeat domain-containing protein [Alteromonas sediminis]